MIEKNVTLVSEDTAKEYLSKKGEPVKVQRTLFNPGGMKRYTLREALDYAASGPHTKYCNITEDMYPGLVVLYIRYNNAITKDGVCKKINIKYFNEKNDNRFVMQEFTNRLKKMGWNFDSPHKRKFSEEKAKKKAAYEATLPRK